MRKGKQGKERVGVEGHKFKAVKSVTVRVEWIIKVYSKVTIEFYQSVVDTVNKLMQDVLLLLSNCRTLKSAQE